MRLTALAIIEPIRPHLLRARPFGPSDGLIYGQLRSILRPRGQEPIRRSKANARVWVASDQNSPFRRDCLARWFQGSVAADAPAEPRHGPTAARTA